MSAKVLLSYYDILGVDRTADEKVIRRAHRQKAEIYHPDKVHHLGERERKADEMEMKLINNARDILLDPDQRELYDQYLDGALEVEEVLEAFIVVDTEMEEERSPLWKKVFRSVGKGVGDLRKRPAAAEEDEEEEFLEVDEIIEVEPLKEGKKEKPGKGSGFDVIEVRPLPPDGSPGEASEIPVQASEAEGKKKARSKGKKKGRSKDKTKGRSKGKKKGRSKGKPFQVVGVVEEASEQETDEDFLD